ncbi:hypothetical protein SDC9_193267 [bioreactor metagenome]|uniref:Uncharacterized protein n=1 Tax=bioreactor metagenome TaxID=1076179 RepID=A0A645I374_9ZZZZ
MRLKALRLSVKYWLITPTACANAARCCRWPERVSATAIFWKAWVARAAAWPVPVPFSRFIRARPAFRVIKTRRSSKTLLIRRMQRICMSLRSNIMKGCRAQLHPFVLCLQRNKTAPKIAKVIIVPYNTVYNITWRRFRRSIYGLRTGIA